MRELGRTLLGEWMLDEGMVFLNHGSFGAAPRAVLEAQTRWRERLERQPVRFLDSECPDLLRGAAAALADFVGTRGADLAFVDNATTAINAVLRGLPLGSGDELVTTTHAYPAVRNALRYVCRRSGARLVEARVPFPLASADEVLAAVVAALGPRTRLAVLDHVTSPTALVLPLEAMLRICHERDVPVLVDGAHAPGMLDLHVDRLGARWYTGNCHKWLGAPKGCAFLQAAPEGRDGLHPVVISNAYGSGFPEEFDWTGTRDPSPYLSVTAALAFWRGLGGARVRARNRDLALHAARRLEEVWGLAPSAPDAMIGSMATVALPHSPSLEPSETDARRLHDRLWERHRIEVPVTVLAGRLYVRVSAQAYNEEDDYERLARAVLEEWKG